MTIVRSEEDFYNGNFEKAAQELKVIENKYNSIHIKRGAQLSFNSSEELANYYNGEIEPYEDFKNRFLEQC